MAKWQRKRVPGFVKNFVAAQKAAHAGGGKTFGNGTAPTTRSWLCKQCRTLHLDRVEECECGEKKPSNDLPNDSGTA